MAGWYTSAGHLPSPEERLAHVACSTLLRVDAEVPSGGATGEPNRWLLTGGGAVQLVEGWQSL